MNIALWILQGLLGVVFLGAGLMKVLQSKAKILANPQMGWANNFSASQIKLIGAAEVLGGVGLVVPWATGICPILTPIAAVCLALLMGGAASVHIKRKEPAVPPLVLAVLAILIAVGRYCMHCS